MKELLLIGGGGHCHSCIDVIEQEGKYKITGILDPCFEVGDSIMGYPILGGDEKLPSLVKKTPLALITLGQLDCGKKREYLANKLKEIGFRFPTIISPSAYVARNTKIACGTVVHHQALINSRSKIGEHCIINTKALIEHDVSVDNYCHISTAAVVNGNVSIQNNCFIGSHSTIVQSMKINEESFIKAQTLFKRTR